MAKRTYTRTVSTSAEPSRKPTFKQYGVKAECYGCGRKLVASKEPMMLFTGFPRKAVYGACCHLKGLRK